MVEEVSPQTAFEVPDHAASRKPWSRPAVILSDIDRTRSGFPHVTDGLGPGASLSEPS